MSATERKVEARPITAYWSFKYKINRRISHKSTKISGGSHRATEIHCSETESISDVLTEFNVKSIADQITATFRLEYELKNAEKTTGKQDYTAHISITKNAAGQIHYQIEPGLSDAHNETVKVLLPCIAEINDPIVAMYLDEFYRVLTSVIGVFNQILSQDRPTTTPITLEEFSALYPAITDSLQSCVHLDCVQKALAYLAETKANQNLLADPLWTSLFFGHLIRPFGQKMLKLTMEEEAEDYKKDISEKIRDLLHAHTGIPTLNSLPASRSPTPPLTTMFEQMNIPAASRASAATLEQAAPAFRNTLR